MPFIKNAFFNWCAAKPSVELVKSCWITTEFSSCYTFLLYNNLCQFLWPSQSWPCPQKTIPIFIYDRHSKPSNIIQNCRFMIHSKPHKSPKNASFTLIIKTRWYQLTTGPFHPQLRESSFKQSISTLCISDFVFLLFR